MEGRSDATIVVRTVVFAPLWQPFDYLWTDALGEPKVGVRILVPLGAGRREAIITEITESKDTDKLKRVLDRLESVPSYNKQYFNWLERAGNYYLSQIGMIFELAFAWSSYDKQRRYKSIQPEQLRSLDKDLAKAFSTKRAISLASIAKHCDVTALNWRVRIACEKGFLEEVVAPPQDVSHGKQADLVLREPQQQVMDKVLANKEEFYPCLLFGCTGSGKTEVYLQTAQKLVREGKQVLILVPEIGLTPMWLNRLSSRFENVGIWHSGLSAREKIGVLSQLQTTDVILGTRSALFLPLSRLGMIVLDEEHDSSFKQQDGVPYSARDMSLLLAQELKIPVILGSATPSLESWRQVKQNNMQCFRLHERVYKHTAVAPKMIDMRGSTEVLSPELIRHIKEKHEKDEQSMLFLNRRGYAPALQCTACGYVPSCKSCSVRLTLHRKEGLLRCHTCDYNCRVSRHCLQCGEQAYLPLGSGTERLEDDLVKAVPGLKVARFDRDTVRNTQDLRQILSSFEAGDIDCLIGTQMLVKGHHFPNVTLVGVINADLGMNMPDFRASERWWQMMTQVFGRTGRGEVSGTVVVQTWTPDAPWFERLDESMAEEVLNDELQLREITNFPPYARWVRIVFSSMRVDKAKAAAFDFSNAIRSWEDVKVTGPLPCALDKLAGRFRFELILRDATRKHLPWKLQMWLQKVPVPSGVRRKVDVDPQDLM